MGSEKLHVVSSYVALPWLLSLLNMNLVTEWPLTHRPGLLASLGSRWLIQIPASYTTSRLLLPQGIAGPKVQLFANYTVGTALSHRRHGANFAYCSKFPLLKPSLEACLCNALGFREGFCLQVILSPVEHDVLDSDSSPGPLPLVHYPSSLGSVGDMFLLCACCV